MGSGDVASRRVLALACACLVAGYVFVIQAARVGDLGVSAPFRYTTVVGAVVMGVAVFDEVRDALTVVGCLAIDGAGVMTARRDARTVARLM